MTVLILEAHHIERGQGKVSKGIGTWQRGRPDTASSPAPPPRVTRSCGRASETVSRVSVEGQSHRQFVWHRPKFQTPRGSRCRVQTVGRVWVQRATLDYLMVAGTLPSPGPRCQPRASLSAACQACSELLTAAITSKVTQVVMGPVQTQAARLQNCTVPSETR